MTSTILTLSNGKGTDPELLALLERARSHVMTPEEVAAQRASLARSFLPAGHDMTADQIRTRILEVDRLLKEATCWGAYVSELSEERGELERSLAGKSK